MSIPGFRRISFRHLFVPAALVAAMVAGASAAARAQAHPAARCAGTWTLVSVEGSDAAGRPCACPTRAGSSCSTTRG